MYCFIMPISFLLCSIYYLFCSFQHICLYGLWYIWTKSDPNAPHYCIVCSNTYKADAPQVIVMTWWMRKAIFIKASSERELWTEIKKRYKVLKMQIRPLVIDLFFNIGLIEWWEASCWCYTMEWSLFFMIKSVSVTVLTRSVG